MAPGTEEVEGALPEGWFGLESPTVWGWGFREARFLNLFYFINSHVGLKEGKGVRHLPSSVVFLKQAPGSEQYKMNVPAAASSSGPLSAVGPPASKADPAPAGVDVASSPAEMYLAHLYALGEATAPVCCSGRRRSVLGTAMTAGTRLSVQIWNALRRFRRLVLRIRPLACRSVW